MIYGRLFREKRNCISGLKKTKQRGSGATRKAAEMLKFPKKEEGEKGKETEGRGKDWKERKGGRGEEEGEKGKGTEWGGMLGMKTKVCKRNEGALLATRKKNIFWALLYM